MPDPSDPDHDELVAAYIDGEATPAEVARVESDPDLVAEVAAFRAVADMVATSADTDTIDADQRDRHIAAALAASPTAENVTSLAVAAHRPWYRQPVTAVAAVIVAALVAVPVIAQLGSTDDDSGGVAAQSAPAATEADEASADAATGEEGGLAPEADLTERSTTGSPSAADLDDGAEEAADGSQAFATTTAAGRLLGRLQLAEGEEFATVDQAAELYDELFAQIELDAAELALFYDIVETNDVSTDCIRSFTIAPIVVARVGDADVVIGRANNETLVLEPQSCEQLFPE